MKTQALFLMFIVTIAACSSMRATDGKLVSSPENLQEVTDAHAIVLKTTSIREIRQGYFDTPDGQIHFWEAGNGPPLLMIHQAGSSSEEFAGLVPFLSEHFSVVSFDWPGHGMSDDPDQELLTEDYAKTALQVIDHLNIPETHVFGNHGGALVAMELAWQNPDRVNSLILAGTSGLKDMDAVQEFSDNLGLEEMNRIDRAGQSLSAAWGRFVNYMPNSEPGEILIAFMNNITVRIRPYDAHYGVLKYDRRPALMGIRDEPILLMQGKSDPFVSDQASLLEILSRAERAVIEDAGVFMLSERPGEIAQSVVEFLSD